MSHADGRQPEDRTEMKRHAGAARVVASCGIDQYHVGEIRQRPNRGLQQQALAKSEVPRLVGRFRRASRHRTTDDSPIDSDRRPSPTDLTAPAVPRGFVRNAHEASADRVDVRRRVPLWRPRGCQLPLLPA